MNSDEKKRRRKRIDEALIDAIESGKATEMSADDWAHIRETVRERIETKGRKRK